MSQTPGAIRKRRGEDEARRPKKKLKIRRQADYHSSSEDEEDDTAQDVQFTASDAPRSAPKSILKPSAVTRPADPDQPAPEADEEVGFDELEKNTALNALGQEDSNDSDDQEANAEQEPEDGVSSAEEDNDEPDLNSEADSASESDDAASTSTAGARSAKKRNDPTAFATSISKILATKLSQPKRVDPILSRSKDVSTTMQAMADSKLEARARALLRAEKKAALESGRVKDVLGLETPDVDTGTLVEQEKRLKKTAQRGVVRLFNAVRAAQVKAEEGMRQAREEGVVGMKKREERVNELSKQGFLDLISRGGGATA